LLTPEQLIPEITLEATATLGQLTLALVKDLQRLGPFGQGHPKPLICVPGVTLASPPRRVGKSGNHLQMLVRQGNATMQCILFNAADGLEKLEKGTVIDLAAQAQLNEYNGYVSVQLCIEDLRESGL
jgi:single-stranded-DNA-specific exonuclease